MTLTAPPAQVAAPLPPSGPPVAAVPVAGPPPEVRRRTGGLRRSDLLAVGGAAAAALALTAIVMNQLAPLTGRLGAVAMFSVLLVGVYALLVSFDESWPVVRDRVAALVVHYVALVLGLALVSVITYTAYRGREALVNLNFFTEDLTLAGPLDPIDVGGVLHAVVGTLQQITLALVLVIPLGITCAVFLNEIPGRFSRLVRTIAEAMTALPSIVAGLFIYATLIVTLGFGKSGLAAALALSIMMLPIVIRASDVVLRLVPASLKEASLAMGAGQWRTVWHVTLPTARSGLTTSVILGTARGIGETSPVLLTAGFTTSLNGNPFSGPQVSLPLAVFELVKSPQPTQIARGFGCAVVLLLLVLALFVLARAVGGRPPGVLSRRQQRRAVRASLDDARRFHERAAALAAAQAGPAGAGTPPSHVTPVPPDAPPHHRPPSSPEGP